MATEKQLTTEEQISADDRTHSSLTTLHAIDENGSSMPIQKG